MAVLPGGDWLMQQIGSKVILFQRYTETEILSFDPTDVDAISQAQLQIYASGDLTPEQKSFAHFWSGYFYAHATLDSEGTEDEP